MDLVEKIRAYQPYNEQEEQDKALILHCLETEQNIFTRENPLVHMTASGWVVNKTRDKVLMVHHNIYNSWSWMGGHADGEEDPLKTAIREVQEESGVKQVTPVSEEIFSLESLTVDGHVKRGRFVSSHIHLNVTYLLEMDEDEALAVKSDENSAVTWFTLEEAVEKSTEPWFQSNVYAKLNEKLKHIVV